MFLPSQGFRHAATLLLTNSIRSLPPDRSPTIVDEALQRLARDLVALAEDMNAPAEAADWTAEEYRRTLERASQMLSHRADADVQHVLESARVRSAAIREAIGRTGTPNNAHRDLFLMYVPEDRLPVAAPLAIELIKRRFSVAFSDFEVTTNDEMIEGIERGLKRHRAGLLLNTAAVARKAWAVPVPTNRFRAVRPADLASTVADISAWLAGICHK
jgi:hypothetical protein